MSYHIVSDSIILGYIKHYIKHYIIKRHITAQLRVPVEHRHRRRGAGLLRSISEMSSCFFGPRPWHIEIRHRVNKNIHN